MCLVCVCVCVCVMCDVCVCGGEAGAEACFAIGALQKISSIEMMIGTFIQVCATSCVNYVRIYDERVMDV